MRWQTRVKICLALMGLMLGQLTPMYALISNAKALADTAPVTVDTFTTSASDVSVDSGSAQIDLDGTVHDNLSGFASMQVYYTSPSGKQVAEGRVVNTTETSFKTAVTFPRYSEPGVWKPTATFMDTSTNVLTLTPQELTNNGFSLNVTVNSTTPDTAPPTLTHFSFVDSSVVDVVPYDITVETDITLSDDLSGVAVHDNFANATIRYVSPSGNQSVSATFQPLSSPNRYRAAVKFLQHVENGIWIAQITAVDNAGNTRVYDANDLNNLGLATAVTVTSEEDTTPVTVTSMGFQPLNADYIIDTYTGGPLVTFQVTLTDDYTGPVSPTIRYRSTTSSQVATAQGGWNQYNDPVVDKSQYYVNFPLYAAEGDWLPEIVTTDWAGNKKTFYHADLLAFGFDMKVTLGESVTEPIGAGNTVTTDSTGTGATVADPVQIAVTSPFSGYVSITKVDAVIDENQFAGYSLLPIQYSISAPTATSEEPLSIAFTLDQSQLNGRNPNEISIFRDGKPAGQCLSPNFADPDACIKSVTTAPNGDVTIAVNSSHASQWVFGTRQSAEPAFTFKKFKKPIVPSPKLNKDDKAGSAITVKFSLGGDFGLGVLAEGSPSSQKVNCNTLELKGDPTPTIAANGKQLKINGNDYYRYDWKTLKDWSGTCRQFKLTFTTGETAVAYFKFK
ncbi:MAG: PxKF domain-containing protein [Candidatus Doudnabacteria bacterium]|nr:PxKF domain-containing protein [Candidatus Doudnabacteria bacterium]